MTRHKRKHEQDSDFICIYVHMWVLLHVLWSIFGLFECQWIYVLLIADETPKSSTNPIRLFMNTQCTRHTSCDLMRLSLSWETHRHNNTSHFSWTLSQFSRFHHLFFRRCQERISVFTNECWETRCLNNSPPKNGGKTVSTNGFLQRLKSLKCDPEQIAHDIYIYFFSCSGIKVNYISLLTGIAVWKKVKCLGCWGFYPFYWEEIPQRELHLGLVQTASLM